MVSVFSIEVGLSVASSVAVLGLWIFRKRRSLLTEIPKTTPPQTSNVEHAPRDSQTGARASAKVKVLPPLEGHQEILNAAREAAVRDIVDSARTHLKASHESDKSEELANTLTSHYQPLILIVDDSKSALFAAERTLRKGPYRIVTAHNGVEALNRVHQQAPDLILTDVEMPEMDGFGLVKRLKKDARYAEIPIIMMTGNVQLHVAIGAQEGINGFLAKPYQSEDLLQQIEYLLS